MKKPRPNKMQVRLELETAKLVRRAAQISGRSLQREINWALFAFYITDRTPFARAVTNK